MDKTESKGVNVIKTLCSTDNSISKRVNVNACFTDESKLKSVNEVNTMKVKNTKDE